MLQVKHLRFSFRANFFRLLLRAAAYQLMQALRREVATEAPTLGRAQFDTLRLRLLKVAALSTRTPRHIGLQIHPRVPPTLRASAIFSPT